MFRIQSKLAPRLFEAIILIFILISVISYSIIKLESVPHIPLIAFILILLGYGKLKKVSFNDMQEGMAESAKSGMSAILLFFFIGILISSWMISGTIPSIMSLGFQFVGSHYFYAIAFILTAIVGVTIGSSLTTIATVGVAFIGMATVLDVSLAVTGGAIVSGAFFGDKMSPLSDTTNLASSMVKVDLFDHIKNMAWTTVPALIISFIAFAVLSPNEVTGSLTKLGVFQNGLSETKLVRGDAWIPFIVLLALAIKKIPALATLAISSLSAILLAFLHHTIKLTELPGLLFGGYHSDTGVKVVDSLLSRGGMESMMFTVSLVLISLSLGGLLFTLGIIPLLLSVGERALSKPSGVILSAAISAIGINILIGEQYLSILLTGEAFQPAFQKNGLENKNLSRTLEDAGTVVNPLVPWSVSGVFISNVIGISTLDYLPFAFFCILSPILTIIFGFTGWTITKTNDKSNVENRMYGNQ